MALIHTQALAKDECFFVEYKSCHSAYRVFEYKYLCKIYYELKKKYAIIILVKERWRLFQLPCEKGECFMTDVILLLTFAVVLTAVNEIIKNIKKK